MSAQIVPVTHTPEHFVRSFSLGGEYKPSAMLFITDADRDRFVVGKERREQSDATRKLKILYGFPQTSEGLDGIVTQQEDFSDKQTAQRLLACALGSKQEGVQYAQPMHKAILTEYSQPPEHYTRGKLLLPILVKVDNIQEIIAPKFISKGIDRLGALSVRYLRINTEQNPSMYERRHNERHHLLISIALQYIGRSSD